MLQLVLQLICLQVPSYNSEQLAVVVRDKMPEVWTLVDLPAGQLIFAPDTNEIKDLIRMANI